MNKKANKYRVITIIVILLGSITIYYVMKQKSETVNEVKPLEKEISIIDDNSLSSTNVGFDPVNFMVETFEIPTSEDNSFKMGYVLSPELYEVLTSEDYYMYVELVDDEGFLIVQTEIVKFSVLNDRQLNYESTFTLIEEKSPSLNDKNIESLRYNLIILDKDKDVIDYFVDIDQFVNLTEESTHEIIYDQN